MGWNFCCVLGAVFLIFSAEWQSEAVAVSCPQGWSEFEGKCYARFTISGYSLQLPVIRTFCRLRGAEVVRVESQAEMDFLYTTFGPDNYRMMSDMTDNAEEGVWRYLDGSRANYTKWYKGPGYLDNPNNGGGGYPENCVSIILFNEPSCDGCMIDETCSNGYHGPRPNICEMDPSINVKGFPQKTFRWIKNAYYTTADLNIPPVNRTVGGRVECAAECIQLGAKCASFNYRQDGATYDCQLNMGMATERIEGFFNNQPGWEYYEMTDN